MTDSPGDGESLVAILDDLTELVSSARAMPMSASAMINRAEVLDLLSSAREVLPGQIAEADKILADADEVLATAEENARKTLADAEAEAQVRISAESVVVAANERASELIAQAEATADELAREADDYCDRTLAEFEIDLGRITSQVAAGRTRLHERNTTEEE